MALPLAGALSGSAAASFAVAVVAYLAEAATTIVGRVLISLGIGIATATGVTAAINAALSLANPASVTGILGAGMEASGFTWLLGTLYSALVTRLTISGLMAGGSLQFWVMRKGLPTS